MPAVQSETIKPLSVQHSVVALRTQGESMRKIAKRLGIATSTVSKILSLGQTETDTGDIAARIVPRAFQVVEKAIDTGDSALAMRYLERTALAEQRGDRYTINGDVQLQQALTLLPPVPGAQPALPTSTPSTPSTTSTLDSSSTPSTMQPTEAAANHPSSDLGVPIRTNFSHFLATATDEQLEEELARRRSAKVIDAVVVEP